MNGMKEFIEKLQYFENADKKALDLLFRQCKRMYLEKGETLICSGDESNTVRIIESGFVKSFAMKDNGEQSILEILGRGDIVMPNAVFLNEPYPYTVEALEKTVILYFSKKNLNDFLSASMVHLRNFLDYIALRYSNAMEKMACLQMNDAHDRMGWFLLKQGVHTTPNNKKVVSIVHDKYIIASYLGMTSETLSRVVKKFKKEGFEIIKDSVLFFDEKALCKYCTQNVMDKCENRKRDNNFCPKDY